MAKDKNNTGPKKSRVSKPYDATSSFVARVTHMLPRWLKPVTQNEGDDLMPIDPNDTMTDDVTEEPPTKRVRSELNAPVVSSVSEYSDVRSTFAQLTRQNNFPDSDFVDGSVAGPSGLHSQRLHLVSSTPALRFPIMDMRPSEQLSNGDDHSMQSDSSISTSGCSSLIPQVKHPNETKSYTRPANNRSIGLQRSSFGERDLSCYLQSSKSLFPENSFSSRPNSSLSKGRPSFNASVFSNPLSPSSTATSASDRVPLSPFYGGRTQYGGASASKKPRHSLFTPNESRAPARQSIQVKSLNSSTVTDLNSCTARRILDALDNLSSPVLDAKRIPTSPVLANSRKRPAQDVSPVTRIGGPSVQDLIIPTVPDLLKLQRRAKMQDSMEAARRTAALPAFSASTLSATEREYKMRLDGDQPPRLMGKMTSKMRDLEEEMREEVHLPNVPLRYNTLPKFDFQPSKSTAKKYSFCHPTPLDSEEFASSKPCTNFKYDVTSKSEPNMFVSGSFKSTSISEKVNSAPNFIPNCTSKLDSSFPKPNLKSPLQEPAKSNVENGKISYGVGVARDLKAGSVMDVLGKKEEVKPLSTSSSFGDAFKPAPGSWECSLCMLRNKIEETKCASCEGPKTSKQPVATTLTATPITTSQLLGFDGKFKSAPGSWECDACMVRNKDGATSCVSCTTMRPTVQNTTSISPSPAVVGFGNQFKAPSDTWECSACMVRNKKDAMSCISCTTSKPTLGAATKPPLLSNAFGSGFGNQFKPSSGTWECAACLVRNKPGVYFCIACETMKQGAPGMLSQDPISTATGFGNMFKKPEGSWECPECMISNKDAEKCVACEAPKPGTKKELSTPSSTIKFNIAIPPEASGFKFGIDKADVTVTKTPDTTSVSNFQFGASKPPTVTSGFTFGMPATHNANSVSATITKPAIIAENSLSAISKTPPKLGTTPTPLFSLGLPKPQNASLTTTTPEVVNGLLDGNGSDRKRKVVANLKEGDLSNAKLFATTDQPQPVKSTESAKNTFSFGSPSMPTATTIGSTVSFNGPTAVATTSSTSTNSVLAASSAPSNLFSFGASKPTSTFGGFTSNSSNPFGAPSAVQPTSSFVSSSKTTQAVFAFGSSSASPKSSDTLTTGPAAKKPASGGFGALASSGLNFTAPSSASAAPSLGSTPRFGSAVSKTTSFANPSATSFASFGSTAATATDGLSKTPAPFTFGSTNDAAKPATSLFSTSGKQDGSLFGNAAVPPKAASYSFGSQSMTAATEPAAASGNFSFNINSTAQKTGGGFSFGSSTTPTTFEAPAGNPVAAAPVFGSSALPSTFGGSVVAQTTTPVFGFGSGTQPSPALFGFNAVPSSQLATPTTAAFTFGQGQAAAALTFNPNVRPTYNFTGGDVPQFTAAGAGNPAGPARRIIKKAVRRTPR